MFRKLTALFLSLTMLLCMLALPASAEDNEVSEYPYVFVHGMGDMANSR